MDPHDPTTWPEAARAYLERRSATPKPAPLLPLLVERIRREGPLPFSEFVEAALYHPAHGYYTQEKAPLGRGGDFVTAPEHHPAFGRLVGRRVHQVAEALGRPRGFTVVEMGAGPGGLAEGILSELADRGMPEGLRYRIIEPIAAWRSRQALRLARFRELVEWTEALGECPPFTGVFASNELPDAFPFDRVRARGGALEELRVFARGDQLEERAAGPAQPAHLEYFDRLGMRPADGRAAEVSLRLRPWAQQAAALLERGSFLTIDYGATAEELYGPGSAPAGTLRAYRAQRAGADPLAAPGRQDITADVDFTTLMQAGVEAGLEVRAFTTQRQFLTAMGWRDWLRRDGGSRRALLDLVDPLQMGSTRVLEMSR